MTIREVAQEMLDICRDGIGWVVLWKEGRRWFADAVWPDPDEDAQILTYDDDDKRTLQEAVKADPMAITVNSWYYNLGDTDEMTSSSLAESLRWHYDRGTFLVRDALQHPDDLKNNCE